MGVSKKRHPPRILRFLTSELNILLNLIFANELLVMPIRLNSVDVLNFLMNTMNLDKVVIMGISIQWQMKNFLICQIQMNQKHRKNLQNLTV